jgi:hypothetical protein
MRIRMKASMRRLVAIGLTDLYAQTKAASREAGKAFLSTMEANTELNRIEFAKEHLPVSEAATEIWEVEMPIVTVYKNALITVGVALQKTLDREKEYENDDAAKATREQLDEVKAQLRELGDQRDFFVEFEEAEEAPSSQLELAGTAAGGRDDED